MQIIRKIIKNLMDKLWLEEVVEILWNIVVFVNLLVKNVNTSKDV